MSGTSLRGDWIISMGDEHDPHCVIEYSTDEHDNLIDGTIFEIVNGQCREIPIIETEE